MSTRVYSAVFLATLCAIAWAPSKPAYDLDDTTCHVMSLKATASGTAKGIGKVKDEALYEATVTLLPNATWEAQFDGTVVASGTYTRKNVFSLKLAAELSPEGTIQVQDWIESKLEEAAVGAGLDIETTLVVATAKITMSLVPNKKTGTATAKFKAAFKLTGTTDGEGVLDAPTKAKLKLGGTSDPIQLADILAPTSTGAPLAIVPSIGSVDGGSSVTVFVGSTVGLTSAAVGGVNLTSLLITGATTITGITGAHAAGAVDVTTTNGTGPSAPLVSAFTYVAPADLSALDLTMRFAAGASIVPHDETVYVLPTIGFPAFPVRVSFIWFGTASAGNSVHREAGYLSWDFNPTVGGVQPMHTGLLGGLSTLKRTAGDTGLNVDRLDNTIPAGNNVANIYGASEGFLWVLVRTPPSIEAGDWPLVGAFGGLGAPQIELSGDSGGVAKFRLPSYINGTTADSDLAPVTTPVSLDAWMVIMARYNGPANTKEIRINGGSWVSAFTLNLSHTQDGQAVSVALPMPLNAELADIGSQQTTVSNAMADSIYLALKETYPAAGLP